MSVQPTEREWGEYTDNDMWRDIHALARLAIKTLAAAPSTHEVTWDDDATGSTYFLMEDRNDLGAQYQLLEYSLIGKGTLHAFRPSFPTASLYDETGTVIMPATHRMERAEAVMKSLLTTELDITEARQKLTADQEASRRAYKALHNSAWSNAQFECIIEAL